MESMRVGSNPELLSLLSNYGANHYAPVGLRNIFALSRNIIFSMHYTVKLQDDHEDDCMIHTTS
jgi:hypothetical protein